MYFKTFKEYPDQVQKEVISKVESSLVDAKTNDSIYQLVCLVASTDAKLDLNCIYLYLKDCGL